MPETYAKWQGPVDYGAAGCVKRDGGLGKCRNQVSAAEFKFDSAAESFRI